MIGYTGTKYGKFITPCNKVSTKMNCLNQKFSKVESKVCLKVSELVNLVSALIYLWELHLLNSTGCYFTL